MRDTAGILITVVVIIGLLYGAAEYSSYRHSQEMEALGSQMKTDNEKLFDDLARKYMKDRLEYCAKHGLGLACKEDALFDCKQLWGSRCQPN